ncbi:MAG: hypothetical protein HYX72_00220 [Acidobacteria bacterium]|nr:hypothetical protein [Acidobacteriota bacterium]
MNSLAVVTKYPKMFLTAAILLAFAAGAIFQGYTKFGSTNASPATAVSEAAPTAPAPTSNLVAQPHPYAAPAPRAVTTTSVAPRPVQRKRSLKKEVLIVAGSSGAGAAIGAVAGGGKGAAIGAVSGGVAGLVYDMATRNK